MVSMLSPGKRRRSRRAVAATPGPDKHESLKNKSSSSTSSTSDEKGDTASFAKTSAQDGKQGTKNTQKSKAREPDETKQEIYSPTSEATEICFHEDDEEENDEEDSTNVESSGGDAVLETLERKKDIFDQLWKGIAELQNGEGQSANAWKEKLRELSEAKKRITTLKHDNEALRKDKSALSAERDRLVSETSHREKQNTRLTLELSEHRESAQRIIRELEESRKSVQAQYKDLKNEEETLRLIAEKRAADLKETKRQAELLGSELKDRETQLAALEPARIKLEEKVALLQTQIETQQKSHEETTSHLAELSQENWSLKDKIKSLENDIESSQKEVEETKASLTTIKSEHDETLQALQTSHDDLAGKLKRTEERAAESREAAEEHQKKLAEHVKTLQEQLGSAQVESQAARAQLQTVEASIRSTKDDCDSQLEKMRNAMRQVQDKHLQDVIRFDDQRKKLEAQLVTEEARVEELNKDFKTAKEALAAVEALRASDLKERETWTAGVEKEYEAKVTALLAEHATEINDLKTKLAEAKAAIRNEAREAQRYKNTLAKAAKEEHDRLAKQIHKVRHELQQAHSKLENSEKARLAAEANSKTVSAQRELLEKEFASREQELQRTLVETQHLVSTKENSHAQECDRLRADTEKQRAHVKALEQEKRDLLMDCKKLNDEVQSATDRMEVAKSHASDLEEKNTSLHTEVERLRREMRMTEEESEKSLESLQQEIDEHVSSRAAALATSEALRTELRKAQKEAAERVAAFSGKASKLEDEMNELRNQLEAKNAELESVQRQAAEDRIVLEQLQGQSNKLNDAHAQEVSELLVQLERLEREASLSRQKADEESSRADKMASEFQSLQGNENSAMAEVKRQTQVIQGMEKARQETLERLTAEQESMRLLKIELGRRKQDMAETQQELAAARAEVGDIDRRHQSREVQLMKEMDKLKVELQDLRTEKDQARITENTLQAQLSALRASSDQSMKNFMDETKALEAERMQTIEHLRASLKEAENNLLDEKANFKRTSKRATADIETKAEEISRLQAALKAAQENGINVLQELEEKTAQYDSLTEDFQTVGKSLQGLEKKLALAEKAKVITQSQLDEEKATNAELRAQLQSTENDVRAQLRSEAEAHVATKKSLTTVTQEKEWLENETNIKISALNRQIQNLEGDLRRAKENAETESVKHAQELKEHELFRETANKALSELRDTQSKDDDSLRQQVEEAHSTADQAAQLCSQMEQERTELHRRLQEVFSELELANSSQDDLRTEHEQMVQNYRELTAVKRKLENQNKKLQLQLDATSNVKPQAISAKQNTSELVLKAEKEGYEMAKKEYQALVARMERDHSLELDRLRQQVERRDSFTSSRPVSPFSAATSASANAHSVSGTAMTTSITGASLRGDSISIANSSRTGSASTSGPSELAIDDEEYFSAGPRAPAATMQADSSESISNGLIGDSDDSIMATAKFLQSRRSKSADQNEDLTHTKGEPGFSDISGGEGPLSVGLPPRAKSSTNLRLPPAKGALPSPVKRNTIDSVSTLKKQMDTSQSSKSLKATSTNKNSKAGGSKRTTTKKRK